MNKYYLKVEFGKTTDGRPPQIWIIDYDGIATNYPESEGCCKIAGEENPEWHYISYDGFLRKGSSKVKYTVLTESEAVLELL